METTEIIESPSSTVIALRKVQELLAAGDFFTINGKQYGFNVSFWSIFRKDKVPTLCIGGILAVFKGYTPYFDRKFCSEIVSYFKNDVTGELSAIDFILLVEYGLDSHSCELFHAFSWAEVFGNEVGRQKDAGLSLAPIAIKMIDRFIKRTYEKT